MLMFMVLFFACFASIYADGSVYPDCTNPDNAEIIPNGSKFKLNATGDCIEYTCKDGGYSATTVECKHNDDCVAVGETVQQNCRTKECIYDGYVGFQYTETKCESDNGQCFSPGEQFTKTHTKSGTTYSKTTCTVNGSNVTYNFSN